MNSLSPAATGFRLVLRRPAIAVGEVAWRWSFAAAGWILAVMFLFEYMDSLPVTALDRILLRTGQPILIGRVIHRIFQGSAFRFTEAGILLALALSLAWIVLASLGRAATVDSIVEELDLRPPSRKGMLRSLFALNFLRAAVSLAALAGAIGSILIASSFWASTRVPVADATRFLFLAWFLVWFAWSVLNWLLSTAAVFAAAEGIRAFPGIALVVRMLQQRPGPMLATGTMFGAAHFGVFLFAGGAAFSVLAVAARLHSGAVLFLGFTVAAIYCLIADFIYTGRAAAYVAITRGDELLERVRAEGMPTAPMEASIDKDELILSDVPLPAG